MATIAFFKDITERRMMGGLTFLCAGRMCGGVLGPDLVAETLYVVGGLYGNVEALQGKATAAELLPRLMARGTKTRTRQQITDELDHRPEITQHVLRAELSTVGHGVSLRRAHPFG